jgi:exopolysaccharide production protein ExoZ
MTKSIENIQGIQILRGIAASAVALAHSQYGTVTRTSTNYFSWDHMLEAGVDLFFVISGFIMMLVSDPSANRSTSPGRFLLRRIQRIVPLYWFYTLLLLAAAMVYPAIMRWTVPTPELVINSLFFIPAFHPVSGAVQPLLSVGWTLQYEMFFYFCFALMIGLALGTRVIAMALLFVALVILATTIGRETAVMTFLSNTIVFEFVAGMGLYWVYRRGWAVPRAAIPIAIVLPILIWAIGSGAVASLLGDMNQRPLRFIAWGLPSLLIVYVLLAVPEMSNPLARALAKLGDASYSLYLCHPFVVALVVKTWIAIGFQPSPAFGLLVVLPIAIIASLISYQMLERRLFPRGLRAIGGLLPKPVKAGQ